MRRWCEASGSFFVGLLFACKFTVFSESRLWECRVLRCFLSGNVVFYCVCLQAGEVRLHFYRVCWQPFMGISYFLVQKSMPGTNVSCFSIDFPFVLVPRGFTRLYEALGGIGMRRRCTRCLAVSLAGWCLHANLQCFLIAVYGDVVFYDVFWEPFMGMSCFYAVSFQAVEVRSFAEVLFRVRSKTLISIFGIFSR